MSKDLVLTLRDGIEVIYDRSYRMASAERIFPASEPDRAFRLMAKVTQTLEECGIEGFVADGTLLGLVRDGGFIAGDNDVDFCVPRENLDELLIGKLEALGLRIRAKLFFEKQLWQLQVDDGGISIDFYGFDRTEDGRLERRCNIAHRGRCLNGAIIFSNRDTGRTQAEFGGVSCFLPGEPTQYLQECYGQNWRTPAKSWDRIYGFHALREMRGDAEFLRKGSRRWLHARRSYKNRFRRLLGKYL